LFLVTQEVVALATIPSGSKAEKHGRLVRVGQQAALPLSGLSGQSFGPYQENCKVAKLAKNDQ